MLFISRAIINGKIEHVKHTEVVQPLEPVIVEDVEEFVETTDKIKELESKFENMNNVAHKVGFDWLIHTGAVERISFKS